LKSGESSEITVFVTLPGKARVPVRICALRKDEEACEKSRKKLKERGSRSSAERHPAIDRR
jgi:hypothetical protein